MGWFARDHKIDLPIGAIAVALVSWDLVANVQNGDWWRVAANAVLILAGLWLVYRGVRSFARRSRS